METKSGWGGRRVGSGRKPSGRRPRAIRMTDAELAAVKKFLAEIRSKQ